jgi:bifunctional DNA-binding transcriptional regulator/antitoxin component of YhaV-PrlF toxin-antitoxin module
LTSKGQITIPAGLETHWGWRLETRVEFVEIEKGQVAMVAATASVQG